MFTVCFRFGVISTCFSSGILVPIHKKSQADPNVAINYRPVIISTIFRKLTE